MRTFGFLRKALPQLQQKGFNVDYASFMNELALSRTPSALRELMKNHATTSSQVIFLGEGLPHPDMIAFSEASFTLRHGGKRIELQGPDLVAALQYQPTQGYPPLLEKLRAFTQEFHAPPQPDERDVITTVGAQDGISKVLELSLERGDSIVVADPTYSGFMSIIRPYRANLISGSFDKKGLNIAELRNKLSAIWSSRSKQVRRPKMMYLNPVANNPSGHVISNAQKKDLYELACEFNLLVLEDDPYFFISFKEEPPQSLLSMDTEGRVVRFDSFSKICSGGMRLGFMVAPRPIVRVVEMHMQASVLHSSALAQMVILQMLEGMGWDGFRKHVSRICDFYRDRRDQMHKLAVQHLSDLADWDVPEGGMFMWMRVRGVPDVWDMVMDRGLRKNVMLVPGHPFMADPSKPCPYIRLSYSIAPMDQVDTAFRSLAELIKEEQEIQATK